MSVRVIPKPRVKMKGKKKRGPTTLELARSSRPSPAKPNVFDDDEDYNDPEYWNAWYHQWAEREQEQILSRVNKYLSINKQSEAEV